MIENAEPLVIEALKAIFAEKGITETIHSGTLIYGATGSLNSLGLVRLIVDLEDLILQQTGKPVVIASNQALSMKHSPFQSVATLTQYLNQLLHEQR